MFAPFWRFFTGTLGAITAVGLSVIILTFAMFAGCVGCAVLTKKGVEEIVSEQPPIEKREPYTNDSTWEPGTTQAEIIGPVFD